MIGVDNELGLDPHGLVRWTPAPPPGDVTTVAAVLDRWVIEAPDREALVDDRRTLSYRDIDDEIDRFAGVLRDEGVHAGTRVAMALPNASDIVLGFMAVMRLGAVWVGVNHRLADPEQEYLLTDSGAELLLALPGSSVGVPGCRMFQVDDEFRARVSQQSVDRSVRAAIDPQAPAAIAYTSGTTGRPKGAVHSQHNLVLPAVRALLDGSIPEASRQGVALPLSIVNLQILGPVTSFLCGTTCIALPRLDVDGLVEGIARHRVGRVIVPPTIAYDLVTRDHSEDQLASLYELGIGGSGAPPGLGDRYRAKYAQPLSTGYGLTEVPTAVTMERRTPAPEGSVGFAVDQLQYRVVDAAGLAVTDGTEGEIVVGPRPDGPFADVYRPMLGYWNRPDATRESVTADGWLRTGDHGRIGPDGALVVIGRHNDVILRGGANVYPAEVERVLGEHPAVSAVAVVGRPDERLGETVTAAIMVTGDQIPDAAALTNYLSDRLARYKIPTEFVVVQNLPRNAMGKVDKKELRRVLFGSQ